MCANRLDRASAAAASSLGGIRRREVREGTMAWKLKGHFLGSCSCTNVCPCPTGSAPPDNPDGTTNCWAVDIFDVREGNLDGVDLSGIRIGLYVNFPDLVTNGNWHIGFVVDEGVSDDQLEALTGILSGQQGGPFATMAPLIGEFAGVERGSITYSDDGASFGGTSFTYEPLKGQDGNPTTVKNAVLGFAPEFEIGATRGRIEVFGHSADASYGDSGDFEYSSESHERIRA
jgi:hypothetical protein